MIDSVSYETAQIHRDLFKTHPHFSGEIRIWICLIFAVVLKGLKTEGVRLAQAFFSNSLRAWLLIMWQELLILYLLVGDVHGTAVIMVAVVTGCPV